MRVTLTLLAALTLAACGFKGNLYLPDGQQPRPALQTGAQPDAGSADPASH